MSACNPTQEYRQATDLNVLTDAIVIGSISLINTTIDVHFFDTALDKLNVLPGTSDSNGLVTVDTSGWKFQNGRTYHLSAWNGQDQVSLTYNEGTPEEDVFGVVQLRFRYFYDETGEMITADSQTVKIKPQ